MKDIPDLLDGLRSSIKILSAFVMALPENKLNRRRGVGFWTVAEHASHLAQVQPMLLERLQRFLDEDRPEFAPYIPGDTEEEDKPPQMEMKAALADFAQCRQQQLALLEKADDAAWKKTASPSGIRSLHPLHPHPTHSHARPLAHVSHGAALVDQR